MREVVAVCAVVSGFAILTRLLLDKAISANVWGLVLAFWVVVCLIAAAGVDRLESLVIEKAALKVTLSKIQETKAEVFAKADEVRRLADKVAEFAVWSARSAGRWDVADPARLLRQRDEIAAMLRETGTSEARVRAIVDPLNETIAFDLRMGIIETLPPASGDPDAVTAERLALVQTNDRRRVDEYVKRIGNDTPVLAAERKAAFDRLEKFLRDGTVLDTTPQSERK
jgi:hypothetical protein